MWLHAGPAEGSKRPAPSLLIFYSTTTQMINEVLVHIYIVQILYANDGEGTRMLKEAR